MIQRIQSLYLSIAAIIIGVMFYLPLAIFKKEGMSQTLMLYGIMDCKGGTILSFYSLAGIAVLLILLTVFIIFKYKNRKSQIKLCYISFLMIAGILASTAFYIVQYSKDQSFLYVPGVGIVLPVISGIFVWLAIRNIKKDEDLVRSADRLR